MDVTVGGKGLDDRRCGAAPGPVRRRGRGYGRPPAAERGAGCGGRGRDGRAGGGGGPDGAGGAGRGVRAVAAGPAGGAGRDPGSRPGPAAGMGDRAGEARHAGDHAAGRTLGARAGYHRAARHRVSRHRTAAACRLASPPDAAVCAQPGRPAAGRGALRADRPVRRQPGQLEHVAVRAAGRRVGHHRGGRRLLPGRRAAARRRRSPGCGPAARRARLPCGCCAPTRRNPS